MISLDGMEIGVAFASFLQVNNNQYKVFTGAMNATCISELIPESSKTYKTASTLCFYSNDDT